MPVTYFFYDSMSHHSDFNSCGIVYMDMFVFLLYYSSVDKASDYWPADTKFKYRNICSYINLYWVLVLFGVFLKIHSYPKLLFLCLSNHKNTMQEYL